MSDETPTGGVMSHEEWLEHRRKAGRPWQPSDTETQGPRPEPDPVPDALIAALEGERPDYRQGAIESTDTREYVRAWYVFRDSLKQRVRARKLRGQRALARAVKNLNPPSFDALLDMLGDSDSIEDRYEALTSPIDVHAFEIDSERRLVTYQERGKSKPKYVGFKRIYEIFNETRKSNPN